MLRLAMLSYWHVHARDYARAADAHPDTEIVAVWDELPERGRAEAEARGVPFFEDLDELLARGDIDAVIVDTPTRLHHSVMTAAARAGKHIFTEKVLAATLREAEEIVAAARAAGVVLVVGLRRVTHASTLAIKDLIDRGALGDLTLVRVRDSHSGALPTAQHPHGWLVERFFNREQAQGGVLTDLCHPLYLVRYLLGRPASVSAAYGYVTGREVEDNAVATLRYPSGALGLAEISLVLQYAPFSIEVHGTQGSVLYSEMGIGERVAHQFGTQAAPNAEAAATGPDGCLHIRSPHVPGAETQWLVQPITQPDAPEAFDAWVAHIQHGTYADENLTLGLDLSAIVEAANRSAATGQLVRLDALDGLRAGG
jgi:1,5-anhydro-D-fructose reductase (1,5-anhydro-D-mannitol-forming)